MRGISSSYKNLKDFWDLSRISGIVQVPEMIRFTGIIFPEYRPLARRSPHGRLLRTRVAPYTEPKPAAVLCGTSPDSGVPKQPPVPQPLGSKPHVDLPNDFFFTCGVFYSGPVVP